MRFSRETLLPWRVLEIYHIDTDKSDSIIGPLQTLKTNDNHRIYFLWSNAQGISLDLNTLKSLWTDLIYPSDENIVIWMPIENELATVVDERLSIWQQN